MVESTQTEFVVPPLFSVVIPLYNKGKSISRTIGDVLAQSFTDYEVIVVDDGSTDGGAKVIRTPQFQNKVRLICKENGGVSSARNRGVLEAKGAYIVFLDADDSWEEIHLSEIAKLIHEYGSEAKAFATNFARKFPDGSWYVNRTDMKRGLVNDFFKQTNKCSFVNSSCVCIDREALIEVGLFNERYTHGEDIDLWFRIARKFSYAYSPVVTSVYNIDPTSGSCTTMNYARESAKDALKGVSGNPYDLLISLSRFLKYWVKRVIGYKPRVRKPRT